MHFGACFLKDTPFFTHAAFAEPTKERRPIASVRFNDNVVGGKRVYRLCVAPTRVSDHVHMIAAWSNSQDTTPLSKNNYHHCVRQYVSKATASMPPTQTEPSGFVNFFFFFAKPASPSIDDPHRPRPMKDESTLWSWLEKWHVDSTA